MVWGHSYAVLAVLGVSFDRHVTFTCAFCEDLGRHRKCAFSGGNAQHSAILHGDGHQNLLQYYRGEGWRGGPGGGLPIFFTISRDPKFVLHNILTAPNALKTYGNMDGQVYVLSPIPSKKLNFADFIEDQFCPIKCEEVFVRRHRGVHHKALVNLFIGNSTFGDTGTSIMIFCTGL